MKKTFFIEISDSKFTFFMGIWRSLNPSSFLLLACNWLKYDYGTFSQSLGVAKHVRIGLKNIKIFCWNKIFHRNFWLKFDISHGAITRKVPYVTTLSVKKFFWDLKSKIRFHSFVGLDLEYRLSTHNMVISLELKAIKNQLAQFCWAWSVLHIKYPQHGHISWIEAYKKIKSEKS